MWLDLPIIDDPNLIKTTSKLSMLAAPEQEKIPLEVIDVESAIPNLKKYILADKDELRISQLSLLAHKLSVMGFINQDKFIGALEIEQVNGMEDIQRIADSLDNYELFPDVSSEKDLGIYLVESGDVEIPQSALQYIDYSKVGYEYLVNHSCAYGNNCLIVKKNDTEMNHGVIFKLQVISDYYTENGASPIKIFLPESPEKLAAVAERLRLSDMNINSCRIVEISSTIADLNDLLPETNNITALNNLAIEIEHLSQLEGELVGLRAVLQAEIPDTVEEMLEIVYKLDDYELIDSTEPYHYGYYMLYEADHEERDLEITEEVKNFIDVAKYGKWRMEKDGVRETDFGLVRRLSEPFEPEESMNMKIGGQSQ